MKNIFPLSKIKNSNTKTIELQQVIAESFTRQLIIKQLINSKAKPTIENIKICLQYDSSVDYINENTLELCKYFYENSITLQLPIPHSSYVKEFRQFAGPGSIIKYINNGTTPMAGCYFIYSDDNNKNYVGQSIFLSQRVHQHSGLHSKSTKKIIEEYNGQGKVKLFPITKDVKIPIPIFLIILEQYLFFILRPTVNKNIIASPGFITEPVENDIKNKEVFVYILYNNEYYYVFKSKSIVFLSKLFNKSETYISSVLRNLDGNCYQVFHFSTYEIKNTKANMITETQLKSIFNFCKVFSRHNSKPVIFKSIDIKHKDLVFSSIAKAKLHIKAGYTEINNCLENGKIFHNNYKVNYINSSQYINIIISDFI